MAMYRPVSKASAAPAGSLEGSRSQPTPHAQRSLASHNAQISPFPRRRAVIYFRQIVGTGQGKGHMSNKISKFSLFTFFVLMMCVSQAQITTGALSGAVTDASGGVLVGARVEVTNQG